MRSAGGKRRRSGAYQRRHSSCRTAPEDCVVAEIDEVSSYVDGDKVFCRVWCSKHGAYYWRWLKRELVT